MDSSLEIVVEGDRIKIECPMTSSYGVDWKFKNDTNEYTLYNDGVIPDGFKMDYSVTNTNNSLYSISSGVVVK